MKPLYQETNKTKLSTKDQIINRRTRVSKQIMSQTSHDSWNKVGLHVTINAYVAILIAIINEMKELEKNQ